MLGARRLEFLLRAIREKLPESYPVSIQTNGILLTKEIADICLNYRVSISISIDGDKSVNDKYRVDKKGNGTHDRVVSGIKLLRDHPGSSFLFSGLLSVIDVTESPAVTYGFLKSLDAPSLDFLYRDGNHDKIPEGKGSFESHEYGSWLVELLNLYLKDSNPPRIRFLDDVLKLCLGKRGVKEGLGGEDYGILIIDTDGSVKKNDTLKSSFNGADKFSEPWNVNTAKLVDIVKSREFLSYSSLQSATSEVCESCEYLNVCGGGMPLHRWSDKTGYENPSIYCNDQKYLIENSIAILKRMGVSA